VVRLAEIYILMNELVVFARTSLKEFDGEFIYVQATPLLEKFGKKGQKVYLRYKGLILPTKVVKKNEDGILLEFPKISQEKPVGDRRSARVPPSKNEIFRVILGDKVKELYDISEEGFGIYCDLEDVNNFKEKTIVPFYFELPRVGEAINGMANLVNIRDYGDKIICGFNMVSVTNADTVKIRFYIFQRIKEILEGEE